MRIVLKVFAALAALAVSALALALVLGGPATLPPMRGITDPFKAVDLSDLPPLEKFLCRGGDPLAFREYKPAGEAAGTVVLIHGSSAHSASMHPMAKAFVKAGYRAFSLDMRGHGASGPQESIKGMRHLEYDVEDFLKATQLGGQATLVGFSAGGGFGLRFAAGERQDLFSGYVLVSPFLSQDAPTYRPGGGGWVSVGIPRIIALSALNGVGIKALNHLPVTRFALGEESRKGLTAEYSFALAASFRPRPDYAGSLRSAHQPMAVVVGEKDELFLADQFKPLFDSLGVSIPVTVVPGVNHIGMILDERAMRAVIAAVPKPTPRAGAGSRG
jgi:non-heme chloroperoxidase